MSKAREIHCFDYITHPYERVRSALTKDILKVFQSATRAAASQAQSIASELAKRQAESPAFFARRPSAAPARSGYRCAWLRFLRSPGLSPTGSGP